MSDLDGPGQSALGMCISRHDLRNWLIYEQLPGRVAQSVKCLATDACLTADPGVASSIPARSQGSRVRSGPGPILSWRLIMK